MTPVGSLDVQKTVEAVFLDVFRIALTASLFSQDQDWNFDILLASEGALMNILYSAEEKQKYGGETAPKYIPLSQLLLECSGTDSVEERGWYSPAT